MPARLPSAAPVSRRVAETRRRGVALFQAAILLGSLMAVAPTPMVPVASAAGTMWYVQVEGNGTQPDGGCASTAFGTIQEAVDAASSGDTIHICTGTHALSSSVTVSVDDLTFEGDLSTNTFVDGGGITGLFSAAGRDVTFRDLTLRNGATDGSGGAVSARNVTVTRVLLADNSAVTDGGAIRATGTVAIVDSTFTNNTASGSGGAVYGLGSIAITDGTFTDNTAGSSGGAVRSTSTITLTRGTFTGNRATGGSGGALYGTTITAVRTAFSGNLAGSGSGGALYATAAVSLSDGTFTGNRATANGGAVYGASTVTLTDGTFSDNSAGTDGGAVKSASSISITRGTFSGNRAPNAAGGAISASGVTIADATFSSNRAKSQGGAVAAGSTTTVSGGTFSGNEATGGTGGALDITGTLTVTGTTFASNAASGNGGAIRVTGSITVTNATFSGNRATGDGGAIRIVSQNGVLINSTFTDNTAGSVGAVYTPAGTLTVTGGTFTRNRATGNTGALAGGTVSITGGTYTGNRAAQYGGAVTGSTVTVVGATFIGNQSDTQQGGAIYASSSASVTDGTFTDNTAGTDGGAVYATSTLTVTGGTYSGNRASLGGALYGVTTTTISGGAYTSNTATTKGGAAYATSRLDVSGGTFTANTSNEGGALAIATNGTVSVTDGTFTANISGYDGGAIFAPGTVTVETSTFRENTAGQGLGGMNGGGGIYGNVVSVSRSTFVGNLTPIHSGGAILAQVRATLVNSTFVANRASAAGAVYVNGPLDVTHGTFVDNTGGIGDHLRPVGAFTSRGSLYVGGTCAPFAGSSSLGGNRRADASGCEGTSVARADLHLGALAANGGPTETIALGEGSAAIDASSAPCATSVDQRGEPRPTREGCDAGAFELAEAPGAVYIVGSGEDCATASYSEIQAAVDAATGGETIHLCPTYYRLSTAVVVTKADLTFEGDLSTNTFVDGGGITGLFSAVGRDVTFRDLTLRNGATDGSGGAVSARNVTAIRSRFLDNTALGTIGTFARGGAIRATGTVWAEASRFAGNAVESVPGESQGGAIGATGAVTIIGGSFEDNVATTTVDYGSVYGGAIYTLGRIEISGATFARNEARCLAPNESYCQGGAVTTNGAVAITDGTFVANATGTAGVGTWAWGGAIDAASVTIDGGSFTDNTSGSASAYRASAGAVRAGSGVTIVDATFTRNRVAGTVVGDGGAVVLSGGTATVTDSDFDANSASRDGGAIDVSGSISVVGSTFTDNTAGASGGAILATSAVNVRDSSFTRNRAAGDSGGALRVSGDVSVTDGTFTGNSVGQDGGAILADAVTVDGGAFDGNRAGTDGGAIRAFEDVALRDVTFADDSAGSYGGAIRTDGRFDATTSTFTRNSVDAGDGGAVFASGAVALDTVDFTSNTAARSGGAILAGATVDATASTFTANSAGDDGGAVVASGAATMRGVSFVENEAGDLGGALLANGAVDIAGPSLFADNTAGSYGGAIRAPSGDDVTLVGVDFLRNSRIAIYAEGPVAVTDGSFIGNTAADGGAVYAPSASFDGTDVAGNAADGLGGGGFGGAVRVISSLSVRGGTWTGNEAANEGGAIWVDSGDATIEDAVFSDNTAGTNGGAILAYGRVDATASTFLRNTARTNDGGAIYAQGDATLDRVDFTANTASRNGGGIAASRLDATASTFVGNAAGDSGGGASAGGVAVLHDVVFRENTAGILGGGLIGYAAIRVDGASLFADNSAGTRGGGVHAGGALIDLIGVDFLRNRGGGVDAYGAVAATDGSFIGNSATDGGAIHAPIVNLDGTDMIDNTAGSSGGAVSTSSDVEISGGTWHGNVALSGDGGAVAAGGSLTVRDATFYGNNASANGGAIAASIGNVVAATVTFVGNRADSGGAVWANGTVAITDGDFVENTAGSGGGGAIGATGTVSVLGGTFERNRSSGNAGAIGTGGIVEVSGATFADNVASGFGGAIVGDRGVSITDGTVTDNSSGSGGGAISVVAGGGDIGLLRVTGGTFTGNRTDGDGGALYAEETITEISGATLADNSAGQDGGALYTGYIVALEDSTLVGNTAGRWGGGIRAAFVEVTNGTFVANEATGSGGAIRASSAAVIHATFVDNSAGSEDHVYASGYLDAIGSLFVGGTCWTGVFGAEFSAGTRTTDASCPTDTSVVARSALKLGPLADNGGPTETVALLNGSAALDTLASCVVASDQRGEPRPVGGACDAGAYEAEQATSLTLSQVVSAHRGPITSGIPVVTTGDVVSWTATVRGTLPNPGGTGLLDPTTGSVTVYACYGGATIRTACTSGTPGRAAIGTTLVDGGADPTDGEATADFDWDLSTLGLTNFGYYTLGAVYDASGGSYFGTATSGDATNQLVWYVDVRTWTSIAIAKGGSPITAPITTGDALDITVTVTGDHPNVGAGTGELDPTSGSVTMYYCYDPDPNATLTSCTSGSWTAITDGTGVTMVGGASATDGTATATLTGLRAPRGGGWYLFAAVYDSSGGTYEGSLTTGDPIAASVYVRKSVDPYFNGPWFVNSSTTVKTMSVSGYVLPETAGCYVRFALRGTTWGTSGPTTIEWSAATYGITRSDGSVSAPLANVPLGIYDVTVSVSDGVCYGLSIDSGTLAVLPGTVQRGSVGGGWYRLTEPAQGWAKNNFGHVISVSSTYNKNTKVTTTITKGQILWSSDADNSAGVGTYGWRLKSTIDSTVTDGTSIWQPFTCPVGVGTTGSNPYCGRFSGTGLLQQRNELGEWVAATQYGTSGVIRYTVTVHDGGSLTTCVRKTCKTTDLDDWYGITILGIPSPTSAADALPQTGTPRRIRNGSIRNF